MRILKAQSNYMKKKNPYEMIERIGKVCYKSEGNIKEGTAEPFVEKMVNLHHTAMLEHGWVHFSVQTNNSSYLYDRLIEESKYLVVTPIGSITEDNDTLLISGSLRALRYEECKVIWDLGIGFLLCNAGFSTALMPYETVIPKEIDTVKLQILTDKEVKDALQGDTKEIMRHIVHSVHFVCDRGVSHEFVRHRPCSFAQESTRYCDYQHNKHGSELTFIEPVCMTRHDTEQYKIWLSALEQTEKAYLAMREAGCTPQEARSVLPNSLKTELVITANEEEWQHIIDLRYKGTTGAPHPDMVQSMALVVNTLEEKSDGRLSK